MNIKVYVIVKCGVSYQGIFAVCPDRRSANAKIKKAVSLEPDNYHDFHILSVNMGEEYPDYNQPTVGKTHEGTKLCR